LREWPAERLDALRSRAAIVEATLHTLSARPYATLSEIADAAGVSRSTLYGHFVNRRSLITAACAWARRQVNEQFAGIDPALSASKSLDELVATSWWVLGHWAGLAVAAEADMSSGETNMLGDEPLSRIRELVLRGREEGAFRSDQNLRWQVDCIYALLHLGSKRISESGLSQDEAITEMIKTIRSLLREEGARFEEGQR